MSAILQHMLDQPMPENREEAEAEITRIHRGLREMSQRLQEYLRVYAAERDALLDRLAYVLEPAAYPRLYQSDRDRVVDGSLMGEETHEALCDLLTVAEPTA